MPGVSDQVHRDELDPLLFFSAYLVDHGFHTERLGVTRGASPTIGAGGAICAWCRLGRFGQGRATSGC